MVEQLFRIVISGPESRILIEPLTYDPQPGDVIELANGIFCVADQVDYQVEPGPDGTIIAATISAHSVG